MSDRGQDIAPSTTMVCPALEPSATLVHVLYSFFCLPKSLIIDDDDDVDEGGMREEEGIETGER